MYGCIAHRLSRWQTTRSEGTPEMVVSMVALQIKCVISDAYGLYICTTPALDAKSFIARDAPSAAGERGARVGSCSGVPGSALGVIKYSKRIFYVTIAQIRARRCRPLATAYGAGPRSDRGPLILLYCIYTVSGYFTAPGRGPRILFRRWCLSDQHNHTGET